MFTLTEKQSQDVSVWHNKHKEECTIKYAGAIGGKYTYCFTSTSMGQIIVVKCACGQQCDITNYDSW